MSVEGRASARYAARTAATHYTIWMVVSGLAAGGQGGRDATDEGVTCETGAALGGMRNVRDACSWSCCAVRCRLLWPRVHDLDATRRDGRRNGLGVACVGDDWVKQQARRVVIV